MINSLLKRLRSDTSRKRSTDDQQIVDISRVIPNYEKPQPYNAQPVTPPQDVPVAQTPPEDLVEVEVQDVLPLANGTHLQEHNISDEQESAFLQAEAAVNALADKHDTWAQADLEALTTAWANACQHADFSEHLQDLSRITHNLKGMAATYGHPAISRIAASLSNLLASGRANTQRALINLHVEACRAAYLEGNSTDGADMVAQSVCAALETQVQRTLQA